MTASIDGFILTGGKSRRMGTDKSGLTLHGRTFIERIAGEMKGVTDNVRVVGGTGQQSLPAIEDVFRDWGALGGVHAALNACQSGWALIVACDFPFVTSELFQRLSSLAGGNDAVAPVQADGIPQPLCTLYRKTVCLARAEQMIKSGERKPIALLQSVNTRWVLFEDLADLTGAEHFFDNINTPEDYARMSKGGITPDRS